MRRSYDIVDEYLYSECKNIDFQIIIEFVCISKTFLSLNTSTQKCEIIILGSFLVFPSLSISNHLYKNCYFIFQ